MCKTKPIISKQDMAFRGWLQDQIKNSVPVKFLTQKLGNAESESVFYEMVCNKACLRPESLDVKAAYMTLRGFSKRRIMLITTQGDINNNF
jgi:hypothetical protein